MFLMTMRSPFVMNTRRRLATCTTAAKNTTGDVLSAAPVVAFLVLASLCLVVFAPCGVAAEGNGTQTEPETYSLSIPASVSETGTFTESISVSDTYSLSSEPTLTVSTSQLTDEMTMTIDTDTLTDTVSVSETQSQTFPSATITPPPTPTKTYTLTLSESNTYTLSILTVSVGLTRTLTLVATLSTELTLSRSVPDTNTKTLEMTQTASLPYMTIVGRHRVLTEDSIRYGQPIEDRTVILELHGDKLALETSGNAWQQGKFLYECITLDVSMAPSMAPFLGTLFNSSSLVTNNFNRTSFLTVILNHEPRFDMVGYGYELEEVSLALKPSCRAGSDPMDPVSFEIKRGVRHASPPESHEAVKIQKDISVPLFAAAVVSASMLQSPTAALAFFKPVSISELTLCRGVGETDLPHFFHPTTVDIHVGGSDRRFDGYLGSLVMSLAISAGVLFLHLLVVASKMVQHYSKSIGQRWLYGCACAAFPSKSIGLLVAFPGAFVCLTVIGFAGPTHDAELQLAAASAALPWVLLPLLSTWLILLAPSLSYTRFATPPTGADGGGGDYSTPQQQRGGPKLLEDPFMALDASPNRRPPGVASRFCGDLYDRFVLPTQEWVAKSKGQTGGPASSFRTHFFVNAVQWRYFIDRFGGLLGEFVGRFFWWGCIEFLFAMAIAFTHGVSVAFGTCEGGLWVIFTLSVAHLVLIVRFMPFNVPYRKGLFIVYATFICATSCVAAVAHNASSRAIGDAAQIMCLTGQLLLLADAAFHIIIGAIRGLGGTLAGDDSTFGTVPLLPLPSYNSSSSSFRSIHADDDPEQEMARLNGMPVPPPQSALRGKGSSVDMRMFTDAQAVTPKEKLRQPLDEFYGGSGGSAAAGGKHVSWKDRRAQQQQQAAASGGRGASSPGVSSGGRFRAGSASPPRFNAAAGAVGLNMSQTSPSPNRNSSSSTPRRSNYNRGQQQQQQGGGSNFSDTDGDDPLASFL